MAEFPKCAEEQHVIVDSDSGVSYRFKTKSDLLLATFMLGAHLRNHPGSRFIPLHIVNSILQHIRDPTYDRAQALSDDGKAITQRILTHHTSKKTGTAINKIFFYSVIIPRLLKNEEFLPDEISFVDGDSILRFVADTKRQAGEMHSFQNFSTTFSCVILHRTIELLVEEGITSLLTAPLGPGKVAPVQCVSQDVLRSMSLIHRSWVHPSQRAMRTIISLFDTKGLYAFLRSPLRGPWLRALRYETPENKSAYNVPATETTQLLSAVMETSPNIEYLTIGTIINTPEFTFGNSPTIKYSAPPGPSTPGFVDIITKLPMLSRLKFLCLKEQSLFFIPQIWRAISALPCLEDVTVLGCKWGSDDCDSLTHLTSLPVPGHLRSVDVSLVDYRSDPLMFSSGSNSGAMVERVKASAAFVSWLVRPTSSHVIKKLGLRLSDIIFIRNQNLICTVIHTAIYPALSGIISLVLQGVTPFQIIADHVLQFCTNLHSLELIGRFVDDKMMRLKHVELLPINKLEVLILCLFSPLSRNTPGESGRICREWQEMDEDIVGLMNLSHHKLRLIELTIYKDSFSDPFSTSELLPKTSDLLVCRRTEGKTPDVRLDLLPKAERKRVRGYNEFMHFVEEQ